MKREQKQKTETKIPFWYPPAWATRPISLSINVIFIGYITFYCTDMLGMSPGLIGALLLASKLFDGVTDIIVGFFIDKTNTRWGKGRPYEIFIVPVWLLTIMMYSVPKMSGTLQAVYVFIIYSLINAVCATFLNAVDAVYLTHAVKEDKNRMTIMSVTGILVMIAAMAFSIVFPQVLDTVGSTKEGWTQIALCLGVPGIFLGILRMLTIPEQKETSAVSGEKGKVDQTPEESGRRLDTQQKGGSMSTGEILSSMKGNKYIFLLFGIVLAANICNNLSAANTYYFKYCVGDIGLMSLVSMTSLLTPVALIFYSKLSEKIGKGNVMRACFVIGMAGLLIRTIGGVNLVTLLIGSAGQVIGVLPMSVMMNAYIIDTMDYGELKTGKRVEGALASIGGFAMKVGGGLASALTGMIMGLSGYDGSLAVQSDMANLSIVAIYNYLPLALFVLMVVLAAFWRLDKEMLSYSKTESVHQ